MTTITKLMNFRIDENVRRSFHIFCIQNDTNIADRLRTYINWDLEDSNLITDKNPSIGTKREISKEQDLETWLDKTWGDGKSNSSSWEDSY